jgi:hypothetical protein
MRSSVDADVLKLLQYCSQYLKNFLLWYVELILTADEELTPNIFQGTLTIVITVLICKDLVLGFLFKQSPNSNYVILVCCMNAHNCKDYKQYIKRSVNPSSRKGMCGRRWRRNSRDLHEKVSQRPACQRPACQRPACQRPACQRPACQRPAWQLKAWNISCSLATAGKYSQPPAPLLIFIH